jgi:hypothetical protein
MNTQVKQIRKTIGIWLTLFIAPMSISLVAIIITNLAIFQKTPTWLWIVTIFLCLLSIIMFLIGYKNRLENLLFLIEQKFRKKRYTNPNILILNGTINGERQEIPPNPVHTDKNPTDWKTSLEAYGWNVKIGPLSEISLNSTPDIVLNPFGEVYPEQDFISNKSINLIREYVWSGGVYVNVAGIPFWYRYNPYTKVRETSGRVEGLFEGKAIWKSTFFDLFPNLTPSSDSIELECFQNSEEINRFGDISNAGGKNGVGVFRAYPLNPAQMIPMLRDKDQKLCLIGCYLHGQGCYLFAGLSIFDGNLSFEKVIGAIKGWARYESNNRKP